MSELTKLQRHLTLLKEEYTKLHEKYVDAETKYSALAAQGAADGDSFASRLLFLIKTLYQTRAYTDVTVKFSESEVPAHKFVLSARSDLWGEAVLRDTSVLDWGDVDAEVAETVLAWMYLDKIHLKSDEVALKIIRVAFEFHLCGLVEICERFLINEVTVRNCVRFYSVAEEISAGNLRDYCSDLICTHWDDLNTSDFEHMSAPLLYKMLKDKTQLPLHSAVRLQRDDVVYLCLLENASRLSDVVNVWSTNAELPLDLALRANNVGIAATLVQHNADVNIRDADGETLLHRAIKHENASAALFLLDNNCDATLTTRKENDSALHLIAAVNGIDDLEKITEKLINKNCNVNAQNKEGLTPLHIAIMADNRPVFELLLNNTKIDVNLKTTEENTPLFYALLKYESGDDGADNYAATLIKKTATTNPLYTTTNNSNSLLQMLILNAAEKAAVFLVDFLQEDDTDHANSNGETALHLACKKNLPCVVEKLLASGANPNLTTTNVEGKQTALHYCIFSRAVECVRVFVGGGANFNARDANGDTPISLALAEGCSGELVPVLIEGEADVNVRNGKDFTLLHQAILKEDSMTAIFLLDHGADINAQTAESETPLQLAIHCRLGDVVDALCTRGVDMSAPDRLGNCPLWAALDSSQEDIASILVRHGADTDCWAPGPDTTQQTLLHRAIDENKESAAIFLIKAGCDLDSPRLGGEDRSSPLHLCCEWGLEEVARTLIEHRANVNSRDADNKTPLHVAIENQHWEIISLLLSIPEIDLSLRDKSGFSAFATALTFRNNKAAQAILDKLPSAAEQFDGKGQNFLHTAIKRNDLESVLFLLSIQVNVNSRVQDSTLSPPLHLAAKTGNETLLRSLILAGARVDDRDALKQTALHVAAQAGDAGVISALIQNGIDFDALDVNNDNALHISVREGHLNAVRALLTESTIDAGAINLKGRNPLHELSKYGKENAAAICDLFLECMPDYPINKPDLEGNTPLLLAYMKGNVNLCRTLVKHNACLAAENHERVNIFNYQVPTKQLLHRLLDELTQQGEWISTDMCQECGKNFSITVRQHHCRHCGRVLCSKCSDQEVPIIKFRENKPVRVCKVCFDVLKTGAK